MKPLGKSERVLRKLKYYLKQYHQSKKLISGDSSSNWDTSIIQNTFLAVRMAFQIKDKSK